MVRVGEVGAKAVRWQIALAWLSFIAGLVVCLSMLRPVFFHNWVWVPMPPPGLVDQLRRVPAAELVQMVAAQTPIGPRLPSPAQALTLAAASVQFGADGRLRARAVPPLTATDLIAGEPLASLAFSSLAQVDALVVAYQAAQQEAYLVAARDQLLSYVRYEHKAWVQKGFLWNDHAVAARVGVLIRFWSVYRMHHLFDAAVAAELLQHVERCVNLLAAPSHFTAWSNHGVMQNLALLQAAAVFPGLVDVPAIQQLALSRLSSQWRYYLSAEGVVLEHSAGYHLEGFLLLRSALELLRSAGLPVPDEWPVQVQRAQSVLADFTRPDGTLPAFGDTRLAEPDPGSEWPATEWDRSAQAQQVVLYPLSGYGIVRSRNADGRVGSHAVLTWSHFPGQAHKQADELGLVLWGAGRSWLTPTGYAHYGSVYRSPVEGWLGSNAPHGQSERVDPLRYSRLRASAVSDSAALLDVERVGPSGAQIRRQVLALGGRQWLVLDHGIGPEDWRAFETVWTFSPDLTLRPLADDYYQVVAPTGQTLRVSMYSASGTALRLQPLRGSLAPFAGWAATTRGMVPAPAVRVLSDPRAWTATLFDLDRGPVSVGVTVDSNEQWALRVRDWMVQRVGPVLHVERAGHRQALALVPGPDVRPAQQQITAHLKSTVQAFPKYRDVDSYRWRVAQIVLLLWLGQLVFRGLLFGVRGPAAVKGRRWVFDGLAVAVWLAAGLWLNLAYLAT